MGVVHSLPKGSGIIATTIGAALTVAVVAKTISRKEKKPFPDVPGLPCVPGGHWLLGQLPLINQDFQYCTKTICIDHANEHGQCSYWIVNMPVSTFTDIRDVRAILTSSFDRKMPPIFLKHFNACLGDLNLVSLRGREWKHTRGIVTRAFTPAAVASYRSAMIQASNALVDVLKNKSKSEIFDFHELMVMLTTDIFGLAGMSTDFGCCKNLRLTPVALAFKGLSDGFLYRMENAMNPLANIYCIPTKRNREYAANRKAMDDFLRDTVAKCKKSSSRKDFLAHLLEAYEEEGKENVFGRQSENFFSDTLSSIMFASFDTMSSSLCYTMYELCRNPEILKHCLEEIDSIPESAGVDKNPIELYPYTYAVYTESLRLYPPAAGGARTLTKDLTLLGGTTIPAGSYVFISFWAVQRNPKNFPRPLEFLPERWVERKNEDGPWEPRPSSGGDHSVDENGIPAGNRDAFFTFSAGGRNCVGHRYAQQQGVLVLTTLLRKLSFDMEPADYEVEPIELIVIQKPKDGLPVRVSVRK